MTESVRKTGKTPYGGSFGYELFHFFIRFLGIGTAYILVAVLVVPYYVLIRKKARKSAYYYLRHRFPDHGKVKLFLAASYHFYQFGKVLIDQAAMGIISKERFRCDFPGREDMYRLANSRHGMVLLTSHAGNWQTAMATVGHLEERVNFLFDLRSQTGRHFFDLSEGRDRFSFINPKGFMGGMVEATNALNAGEVVAIMGDRVFGAKTIEVDFLGEKALFPMTPFQLAAATGASLAVLLTVRTGKLSYSIEYEDISKGQDWTKIPRNEAVKLLSKRYVTCLENYLSRHPFMWYNFFDFWMKDKKYV